MSNSFYTKESKGIKYNFLDLQNTDIFKIEIVNKFGASVEAGLSETMGMSMSGALHLIEHLSFKSPLGYETLALEKELKRTGVRNASTGFSRLKFHHTTISKHALFSIKAMVNVAFNSLSYIEEDEFAKEKSVVINEINGYHEDDPFMHNMERYAFITNKDLEFNLIGVEETLSKIELDDLIEMQAIIHEHFKFECEFNIMFDSTKSEYSDDEIISLIEVQRKKLDDYAPFPLITESDVVVNYDKININKTKTVISKNMNRTHLSLITDTTADVIVQNVVNSYMKSIAEDSLHDVIRTKHGLTYNIYLYKFLVGDVYHTSLQLEIENGNEDKVIELINETLKNISENYTEEKHDELIESLILKEKMDAVSLYDMTNLFTYTNNSKEVLENIDLKDNPSYAQIELIEKRATYDACSKAVMEFYDKVKNKDYALIISN